MLRRTVAIVLLAMIGLGFYSWAQIKKETITGFNQLLTKLEQNIDAGNKTDATATLEEIKTLYTDKQDIFNLTCDHELMASLNNFIAEIEIGLSSMDVSATKTSLAHFKNRINDFYEDNKIKLSNII